ncbi:MAG: hypothetical protein P8Y96_00010 [Desulfuromonadales bacterium]
MIKIQDIADGIREGNLRALAKAITLIESRNLDHSVAATTLLDELLPDTGRSIRIGISRRAGRSAAWLARPARRCWSARRPVTM